MTPDELLDRAQDWLAEDPDPVTRAELEALIERAVGAEGVAKEDALAAVADLSARFAGRLAFGTAGLRAELGAGPMRMNRVVVAQAAGGLARYLLNRSRGGVEGPSIVIGYDGRHNSEVFARDSATIMAGAGVRTILLPRALPTPVLAFAVRHFDVSAGVMVTASHNPPRDNGYKVYLGGADGGSQIVAPADKAIADEIASIAAGSIADLPRSTDFIVADDEVVRAYVEATASVVIETPPSVVEPVETTAPSTQVVSTSSTTHEGEPVSTSSTTGEPDLRIIYTPMHGVGLATTAAVFEAAGLPAPHVVPEQAEPDPDFPTVAFPNPEEPGALDLAYAHAREIGADLIVANDPDADRLAIAVPDARREEGWRRLTGNEIGLLLGWAAAEELAAGRSAGRALANSLVSSPALALVAERFGLAHVETLTGFKWISRVPGLVFGYEEALGYLVDPGKVRDKDGISAAARFVDLVIRWRAEGRTVDDVLDAIAAAIGGSASGQVSIRVTDLADIARAMAALRAEPPSELAGRAVVEATDFLDAGSPFPGNDILRYRLADGSRIIVRPSGTEPKLKVYLDAAWSEGTGRERRERAAEAVAELEAGVRELLGIPA